MNYYKMLLEKNPMKEALVVDGVSYTYGELIKEANALGQKWDSECEIENSLNRKWDYGQKLENAANKIHNSIEGGLQGQQRAAEKRKRAQVRVIKEKDILTQLVSFFACSIVNEIPLLVPYDGKAYRNGQHLSDIEVPKDACMAVATSGTTGVPKIYFRTFESWAGYFPIQNEIFLVRENSRLFVQGSLAFTGNLNLYMAQFYAGATVIAENVFSPKKWAERICMQHVDGIYLIPSKLMLLMEVMKEKVPGVRMIVSGSQSMGKQEADRIKSIFPNTNIVLYYGASELNYITYVTYENMTEERNLIGKPFPEVEVFLQNEEIYVNTAYHVKEVTCPYSLSDSGYQDEEGNFYFAGRKDDILCIRGRKVSSVKIENALEQLPEIKEAAVVAESGSEAGQQYLVAYIVLREGNMYQEQEIYKMLRQSLAHYEMPRKLYPVESLPRNESGKVDKQRLVVLQW